MIVQWRRTKQRTRCPISPAAYRTYGASSGAIGLPGQCTGVLEVVRTEREIRASMGLVGLYFRIYDLYQSRAPKCRMAARPSTRAYATNYQMIGCVRSLAASGRGRILDKRNFSQREPASAESMANRRAGNKCQIRICSGSLFGHSRRKMVIAKKTALPPVSNPDKPPCIEAPRTIIHHRAAKGSPE